MSGNEHDAGDGPGADELERLGSRLAMLVSEDGEAANAGRAVAVLARKLRISGGELKASFLAGASGHTEDATRLREELAQTRRNWHRTQDELQRLAEQNAVLEEDLARTRTVGHIKGGVALAALAGLGVALVLAWGGRSPPAPPPEVEAHAGARAAVVRAPGAKLRAAPDPTAPVVVTLPAGTRVTVRSLPWKNLMQWAEIEAPQGGGYVQTTAVEMQ